MASNNPYPDPDAGLYANQNGGSPPSQQQPPDAQLHDPDLQMHESMQRLRHEMMPAGGPQVAQMAPMGPALGAHHQFHTPPRPNHSPQQVAQSVINLDEHNPFGDHDSASRKRSKVSRACDECRRKKIRCDATSENGPEACSSCKRTSARCQFSRQPMKRGPSKGYIKELADRLNSLESQIQHPSAPSQGYDFGAVVDQNLGDMQTASPYARKRTHSISEGPQDAYGRPGWSGHDRGTSRNGEQQLFHSLTHQDYPPNGSFNRRASFGEMNLAGSLIAGSNEGPIKAYYELIHPTLPLLPPESSPSSLNRLTLCPPKFREALFLSLECAVRSFAPGALPGSELTLGQLLQQCSDTLEAVKPILHDADGSRQLHHRLVYGQSLALLFVATDRSGPSAAGDPHELLHRLAASINEMGLNNSRNIVMLREQDQDMLWASRRLYQVAIILDRFHAVGRDKELSLPLEFSLQSDSSAISRDDLGALGEAGYHLAHVADIGGQLAYLKRRSTAVDVDPSNPFSFNGWTAQSPCLIAFIGQLRRLGDAIAITSLPKQSPPHLAYQYLRIVVAQMCLETSSNELLALVKELLSNLIGGPITPLHHIFATFVATCLNDLSNRLDTQVEARASIREMNDALANGRIAYQSPDGTGWNIGIRDILQQRMSTPQPQAPDQTSPVAQSSLPNMAGLQHLAAAAVGEREGADARPPSSGGNNNGTTNTSKMEQPDLSAAVAAANEAAKAQATAAAAQQQMSSSTNGNGNSNNNNNNDSSGLPKDGN